MDTNLSDTSNNSTSDSPPSAAEVNQEVTSALSDADAGAVDATGNLKMVQQARVSRLTRTAATLTTRFGASDPRAVTAQSAVSAGVASASRIAMVNQQIATPAPSIPAGGWVLHGRVFDAKLQPVSKQTVFLVDEQNAYQSQYGFAYTDDSGYFQITFAGGSAVPAAPKLFVQVANDRAQPVFLGSTPVHPPANTASYQNVILPGGPIGDPPPAVRSGALPNPKA